MLNMPVCQLLGAWPCAVAVEKTQVSPWPMSTINPAQGKVLACIRRGFHFCPSERVRERHLDYRCLPWGRYPVLVLKLTCERAVSPTHEKVKMLPTLIQQSQSEARTIFPLDPIHVLWQVVTVCDGVPDLQPIIRPSAKSITIPVSLAHSPCPAWPRVKIQRLLE